MLRTKLTSPTKRMIILDVSTLSLPNDTALYTGASKLIRELYRAAYKVVVLTDHSDLDISTTQKLLVTEALFFVRVYGLAERKLHYPTDEIISVVCNAEKVTPLECVYIDTRLKSRKRAQALGMNVIPFKNITQMNKSATAIDACRIQLLDRKILSETSCAFTYPTFIGMNNNEVVHYEAETNSCVEMDDMHEEKNQFFKKA